MVYFSLQSIDQRGGAGDLHELLEIMVQEGRHETALTEAERWFDQAGGTEREAIWVAVSACKAAWRRGEWGKVVAWADRGLHLHRREPEAEGLLRFVAASALMYIGDLYRAERELSAFRQLAETVPALQERAADGLYNLGYLKRLLRQYDEAVGCFGKAAAVYGSISRRTQWVIRSHWEIGWTYLTAGRADEAMQELERVRAELAALPEANRELELALGVATAWGYSQTDRLEESDRLCLRLCSLEQIRPQYLGEIAWIQGNNALARGDLKGTAGYLDTAWRAAVQDWWPPLMERVNQLGNRLATTGAASI